MNFSMRPPAIPLINVDPYFSLWAPYDKLTDGAVRHWTGAENNVIGSVIIDGVEYGFLGKNHNRILNQVRLEITAFTTELTFENEFITLYVKFCSPLIPDDIEVMSEPIGYMECSYESKDFKKHEVKLKLMVTEELCLDKKGEDAVNCEQVFLNDITCYRMGSASQRILWRCGDDVRIDWGYFYLASNSPDAVINETLFEGMKTLELRSPLCEGKRLLSVFAYDDVDSIMYFGRPVKAYWKRNGIAIDGIILNSFNIYDEIISKCYKFSEKLDIAAKKAGNSKYSEMLNLAFRQIMSAHKLAVDENGELIYISKECFSNGCAGTVDIAYPSSPMFMLFNSELLKAMLRPIFRYADSDDWQFEFAPHDLGRYPLCNGQVYFNNDRMHQMPIEECGNMLIMCATIACSENSKEFLRKNNTLLKQWADYLIKNGLDPENQLCSDDFSGHLAHNCNLSAKAIMGVKGYGIILERLDDTESSNYYNETAKRMANDWMANAYLNKGWYRHTFDSNEGYSLKYNLIWDKVWKSELFEHKVYECEIDKYKSELKTYGVPLDQRAEYTKSDWMLWIACFADNTRDFCLFSDAVWKAFNSMNSRVPMTDWYNSTTSEQCTWTEEDGSVIGFQHRSVQGGLFMKLLLDNKTSLN